MTHTITRHGWRLINDVWHYVRGQRTLCLMRTDRAIVGDEMNPGLPNCAICETRRLAECAPRSIVEWRE
jgi:hypothetical protein